MQSRQRRLYHLDRKASDDHRHVGSSKRQEFTEVTILFLFLNPKCIDCCYKLFSFRATVQIVDIPTLAVDQPVMIQQTYGDAAVECTIPTNQNLRDGTMMGKARCLSQTDGG